MVERYDPQKIELEILKFWDDINAYKKAKEKVKNGKDFYFLDGPPYANGKVHLGHAWNKSLKDEIIRYKRKKGFNVFDRAGYDMHGLPIEHATEQELGLKDKEDIKKIGEEVFIAKCKELAERNLKEMNKDFKRMGVWMDFENAYRTIKREFILNEWWLIKRAHEEGRLYEAYKTMHWCAHCGTALAKHELEYKTVKDKSIFVKFKVANKENEYLLVWTTTPWTLPFNLGVMVNPEMDYVKVKVDVDEKEEFWIISRALMNIVVGGILQKKYEIIEEFKGSDLEGLKYEPVIPTKPLMDAVKNARKPENAFTVLLSSEYVTPTAGTGLVHCAPGCGPEDYEVGYRYGLPIFNNIDENGIFPESMDWLAGLRAKVDDPKVIEYLKEKGFLLAVQEVEHEYAHCWRCKNPVVFRTTKQWFFKTEDIKDKLLEFNSKVKWVPDWSGSRQFASWLENLRDNTITRQRYWGAPVPIWRCKDCGYYEVIASDEDAEKLGGKLPEDLHKPEIDKVVLKCPKCGGEMHRIPDVLDVWIDSGTTSWNALDYPTNKELFEKLYPPDFILEGKDQIRGWFNLLMIASTLALNSPAFKACYMHGFINDKKGRKMSKSLKNYIVPNEIIDTYGADTMRYYFISGTNPGLDLNYNDEDARNTYKKLNILWNIHNYLLDLYLTFNEKPLSISEVMNSLRLEDKYILSKVERAIRDTEKALDDYRLNEAPLILEEAFLDLSRKYIKIIRDRINKDEERRIVLSVLIYSFSRIINALSIVVPFITEKMYQNLRNAYPEWFKQESIHLEDWPIVNEELINVEIEKQIDSVFDIVTLVNYAREKARIKKRWPIKRVDIISLSNVELSREAIEILKVLINTKEIVQRKINEIEILINTDNENAENKERIEELKKKSKEELLDQFLKEDEKEIENLFSVIVDGISSPEWSKKSSWIVVIDKELTPELKREAILRDLIRMIQQERKSLGLIKTDIVNLLINTDKELMEVIKSNEKELKEKCGLSEIIEKEIEEKVRKGKVMDKEVIFTLEKKD